MITKVIKRNGTEVEFDKDKIYNAIMKAMKYGSGVVNKEVAEKISNEIEDESKYMGEITISQIESKVFNKLIEYGQELTAKSYEGFRKVREYQRSNLSIDESIEGVVNGTNTEVMKENSNKDGEISSTQRDLIAGEFSKDYSRRKKLPANIVENHDNGAIHFHDMDYYVQHIHNCCLVNLKDMFTKGTVINGKLIETPKSLATATTVATQIVQQVANGQYGGQTISIAHLAPFVRVSYEKHLKSARKRLGKKLWKKNLEKYINRYTKILGEDHRDEVETIVRDLLKEEIENAIKEEANERIQEEIKASVQTLQYQINTFSTSNGQAPFLTVFMYLKEEPEYIKETAMLIEEILNQRYQGMKNEAGQWITPAFPKLIYVLDDNNVPKDSEYRYLTDLAVKCVAKRMMPDFISAKIMRENYDGEVFGPMGKCNMQPRINRVNHCLMGVI